MTDETGIGPESQETCSALARRHHLPGLPDRRRGPGALRRGLPVLPLAGGRGQLRNKKATGATFVTDAGGFVDKTRTTDAIPRLWRADASGAVRGRWFTALPDCDANPLAEVCTTDGLSRTERGPVLTAAFQGFLGQTSVMHWGKTDYVNFDFTVDPPTYVGENGGISGMVYYATTRAEDEPQLAAAEEWEPGVPRVQVNLYADGDIDSFPLGRFPRRWADVDWNEDGIRDLDDDVIDDINGDGVVTLSDVDNYPFDNFPGAEDVDRNSNRAFDLGDAVQVTWTDSWDDSLPTGCQGANNLGDAPYTPPVADNRCFDGLRNFNQIRPGVFDGGYAFADYDLDHLAAARTGVAATAIQAFYDSINGNGTECRQAAARPDPRRLHRRGCHASRLQADERRRQERRLRRRVYSLAAGDCRDLRR